MHWSSVADFEQNL